MYNVLRSQHLRHRWHPPWHCPAALPLLQLDALVPPSPHELMAGLCLSSLKLGDDEIVGAHRHVVEIVSEPSTTITLSVTCPSQQSCHVLAWRGITGDSYRFVRYCKRVVPHNGESKTKEGLSTAGVMVLPTGQRYRSTAAMFLPLTRFLAQSYSLMFCHVVAPTARYDFPHQ